MFEDNNTFEPRDDREHDDGLLLPPWERRERFGFLNALYLTVKDVLLAPSRFFQRMPSQVGLLQPLLFAIILGALGTFIAWLYSLVSASLQMMVFGELEPARSLNLFFVFLFSPVLVAGGLFVQAGLTHGILMLLGGNRLGFEATFRVMAYSEAAGILLLVPICGSPVALVWSLIITIIGVYAIHDTDPWRAIVAVVLPTILCLSTIFGSVAMLVLSID